ncbi:hypothetical protein Avbf_00705 [Armadillidium vulgare]|nr:hypothetical protein Avbf_00705 [Armadillidium vulgare]
MTYARDYYYFQLMEKEALLQKKQEENLNNTGVNANPEVENMRKQLEGLQLALYKKDEEIQQLREPVVTLPSSGNTGSSADQTQLYTQYTKSQIKKLEKEKVDLDSDLQNARTNIKELEAELTRLKNMQGSQKNILLEAELEKLQSEQEDLLVLLTDQETKISEMKRTLRSYGEVFSDDDDNEDEDDLPIDISSEEELDLDEENLT